MDIKKALLGVELKKKEHHIKELDLTVNLREMDGKAFDRYESMMFETDDNGEVSVNSDNLKAKMIISCVYDSEWNYVFNPEDIEVINNMPGSIVKDLAEECAKISGVMSVEGVEKN